MIAEPCAYCGMPSDARKVIRCVTRSCIERIYRGEYGAGWRENLVGTDRALYESLGRKTSAVPR